MRMPVKIKVKGVLLCMIFAAACVLLNFAVRGVPLSSALYFALLICGGNAAAAPVIYIACSAAHFSLVSFLCALFEALTLLAVTLLYRRTARKMGWEAAVYHLISLAPFIALSGWDAQALEALGSGYASRAVAAAACVLLLPFAYKCVYALMFRAGRCRLCADELFALTVTFAAAGIGFINLAGEFAWYALAAFVISISVRMFRSPSSLLCALACGLPAVFARTELSPATAMVAACAFGLLFARAGRAVPFATGAVTALYCLYEGMFSGGAAVIAVRAAVLAIACVLAVIPSDARLKALADALTVKKLLPDEAADRVRARAGEKLFRISEAFREVECAFKAMDEVTDEAGAKRRVCAELKERLCSGCEKRQRCEHTVVYKGFAMLTETGAAKGKVSLIDLPPAVTQNCARPADAINALNALLADYRRFMTEAENVRAGRLMLADQAAGVAAVLKNNAVELCREHRGAGEVEASIMREFAAGGIACPEAWFDGDSAEAGVTVVGPAAVNVMLDCLERATGGKFQLREKHIYGDSACYMFCRTPRYDAVFGVASAIKEGEKASGDTHSVIRINEHRFLMALCDGMGSGIYARKVSRTAISLTEAFYRAQMPEGTVLSTINKLLTFSRDERFACMDICSVDLATGNAEFVKIGAPAAFILRGGKVKVLESQSLPLGILDGVRPTTAAEKLQADDMLVFVSDGITSAFDSTPEIVEFLSMQKPLNPQNLADELLAAALKRTNGRAEDDLTALCTRIFTACDEEQPQPDAV